MAYHSIASTSTMPATTPASSVQYFPSSSVDSQEFYFTNDKRSVDFKTTGLVINDKNCTVDFKINKKLVKSGQYDYKFLVFDDSNRNVFHEFDRENPTEEWEDIFYSRASQRYLTQKVELAGAEVTLMTGPITSQFISIEIEDFVVKSCFHGIFIFVNKAEEQHSSWIVNYSHDERIVESEFPVYDLRTGLEEDFGPPRPIVEPRPANTPLIKFYAAPYDDQTLGLIIFADLRAFLQKKSWNSNLLTADEIRSSIKNTRIIKYKFKNKKKENLSLSPSKEISLSRVDFNVSNNPGIVSFVARDGDYLPQCNYEYEFLITIEDPTRNKVEKIFNELKDIREALFSIKQGKAALALAREYFAQIINLVALWYGAYTSEDADHRHVYTINPTGNGLATLACNPSAAQICHQHKIDNGVVAVAQSSCYPNCEDEFGQRGAPPHSHTLSDSKGIPNSFAFIHRLATETNLRMIIKNVDDALNALIGFMSVVEQELPVREDKLKITQNSGNKNSNIFISEKEKIKVLAIPKDRSLALSIDAGESVTGLKHMATANVESVLGMSSILVPPAAIEVKSAPRRLGAFKEDVGFALGSSEVNYADLAPTVQAFASSMTSNLRQGKEVIESPARPTEEFSFGEKRKIELEILTSYFIDESVVGISDVWKPLGRAAIPAPGGSLGYSLVRIKNPEIVINKYFVLSDINE